MSELQWALLILTAVVVVLLVLASRRSKRDSAADDASEPAAGDQLDILLRDSQFDEFGVGKPRKRGGGPVDQPAPAESGDATGESAGEVTAAVPDQKIVVLLIVEPSGKAIAGRKIHDALRDQGLEFGEREIYHRMSATDPVFSVAGLLKPGTLDPQQADQFSAPGLSVFMVLPGPVPPQTALRDMVETARRIAAKLEARVFNSDKQPLENEALSALGDDVKTWAEAKGL